MKTFIFFIILAASVYFGTGGFLILQNDQAYEQAKELKQMPVEVDGICFYNREVMIAATQQDLILKIYPYALNIPSFLSFIITALSFGIIGSIGKVINDIIHGERQLNDFPNLLLIPLQGAFIGLIILGISFAIPVILTSENISLKPIAIVILSLFGGIYYRNFYSWITNILEKTLFVKKDPDKI